MKTFLLVSITAYQKILSNVLKNILGIGEICRFSPSCSEYAKISIRKEGVFRGGYKFLLRFLKCQPFYKKV